MEEPSITKEINYRSTDASLRATGLTLVITQTTDPTMNATICFSVLMMVIVVTMTDAQDCRQEHSTFIRSSCSGYSSVVRSTLTDSQVVKSSQVADSTLTNARISGSTVSKCTITGSVIEGKTLFGCTVINDNFTGCN